MDKIAYAAKAVAGMVVGILSVLIGRLSTEGAVIPDTLEGWLVLLAAAVVGYFGVYLPENKLDEKQVAKGVKKLPPPGRERILALYGPSA